MPGIMIKMCIRDRMEDYDSLKVHQPKKLEDETFMTGFLRKYGCYVTKFYKA